MNYLDQSRGGGELVSLARHLIIARGSPLNAAATAEAQRAPERTVRILKSAISAATLADPVWAGSLADYRFAVGGFVESLRSTSVFDRLLADGAVRRVPLHTRIVVTSVGASAAIVASGASKPASRLSLISINVEERKATALVPVTEELMRSSVADAEANLAKEMRGAVSAATNAEFLAALIDSSTPTVSGGGTGPAAVAADLSAAAELIPSHLGQRLYLIVDPVAAKHLAFMTTADGVFAFPDMTPNGGSIAGVAVLPSDALPAASSGATSALLIDASNLALGDQTITLDASRNATYEANDAPTHDATTPTAAQLVSGFQTNSVLLKAERYFGAARVRDDAVVLIEDAAW
jgi:HK97 family phage major capsid protein